MTLDKVEMAQIMAFIETLEPTVSGSDRPSGRHHGFSRLTFQQLEVLLFD